MSTQTPSKAKTLGLHILAGLLALAFLAAGGSKLAGAEQHVQNFARMGLPHWFLYVTGAVEVLAAILIAIPKSRAFGAALLVPTMIGGALAHITTGDPITAAAPALVLLGLSSVVLITTRHQLMGLLGDRPVALV